jgi:hypothetical protein
MDRIRSLVETAAAGLKMVTRYFWFVFVLGSNLKAALKNYCT